MGSNASAWTGVKLEIPFWDNTSMMRGSMPASVHRVLFVDNILGSFQFTGSYDCLCWQMSTKVGLLW
jgi:hypothetical protein